jgi:hypothetical protein
MDAFPPPTEALPVAPPNPVAALLRRQAYLGLL